MRLRLMIALASTLVLAACGGAAHGEPKQAEADPWAGYKGTYATTAGASTSPAPRTKAAHAAAPKEPAVAAAEATPATPPVPTLISTSSKSRKSSGQRPAAKKAKK